MADIVSLQMEQTKQHFIGREAAIDKATAEIEVLVDEYFDVHPLEKLLIADTLNVTIPSIQPTQNRMPVPTVKHSNAGQRDTYKNRVCEMLNGWSKGAQIVRGQTTASDAAGIGMVVLEKLDGARPTDPMTDTGLDVLQSLDRLRKIAGSGTKSVDPTRGLMLFDKSRLYIVKPIGQRFWTETAALNDADEIAGTILVHSGRH